MNGEELDMYREQKGKKEKEREGGEEEANWEGEILEASRMREQNSRDSRRLYRRNLNPRLAWDNSCN